MIAVPNPTMRMRLLDEVAVGDHRSLFCPEYDACLDIAVSGRWTSWSCEHCSLAARTTTSLVLRMAPAAALAPPPETPSRAMPWSGACDPAIPR